MIFQRPAAALIVFVFVPRTPVVAIVVLENLVVPIPDLTWTPVVVVVVVAVVVRENRVSRFKSAILVCPRILTREDRTTWKATLGDLVTRHSLQSRWLLCRNLHEGCRSLFGRRWLLCDSRVGAILSKWRKKIQLPRL